MKERNANYKLRRIRTEWEERCKAKPQGGNPIELV
jgi:hypothetical protein